MRWIVGEEEESGQAAKSVANDISRPRIKTPSSPIRNNKKTLCNLKHGLTSHKKGCGIDVTQKNEGERNKPFFFSLQYGSKIIICVKGSERIPAETSVIGGFAAV